MNQLTHVNQLLDQHDVEFVVSCYESLLGRNPDNQGADFYVSRLRAGFGRTRVLAEIAASPEAHEHGAKIAGLSELLAEFRKTQGRNFLGRPRQSPTSQLDRLENSLGRIAQAIDRLAPQINHCVVHTDEMRNEISRLRDQLANAAGLAGRKYVWGSPGADVGHLPLPVQGLLTRLQRSRSVIAASEGR